MYTAINKSILFLSVLMLLTCSACVKHERLVNFNQGAAFPEGPQPINGYEPLRIQADDLLTISVTNMDPSGEDTRPFNVTTAVGNEGVSTGATYLVDIQGQIEFPALGTLKVAGLTTLELKKKIRTDLSEIIRDPIVNVRFVNFKIFVQGEVKKPGIIQVPGERINILQAISAAGDFTNFSNREYVLIIREQDGMRSTERINLRDRAILDNPYFYLKQNDFIYVEPTKSKAYTVADPTQKILPWAGAVVAVLNLVIILNRN